MPSLALLFILAAIGISETIYLIRKRIASEKPFCPMGGGCHIVLASRYNKLLKVPNDMIGLLFYISIALAAAMLAIGIPDASIWITFIKISIAAASVMSLFLIYIQWRIIRSWCFWCVMSALTVWLMGVIALTSNLFT